MKIKAFLQLSPLLLLSFLFSCNQQADASLEYTVKDVDMVLEGPLFQGTNDGQASFSFQPEEVLAAEGYERSHIKDIRVKKIALSREDAGTFNPFESILLQLTGQGASLTSVAVMNPVPDEQQRLEIEGSQKASLEELRNAEEMYLVMDTNLADEHEDDILLSTDIIFLIDVKK